MKLHLAQKPLLPLWEKDWNDEFILEPQFGVLNAIPALSVIPAKAGTHPSK